MKNGSKYIEFNENFQFFFEDNSKRINVLGLLHHGSVIANDWLESVDFIAIMEASLHGKLGTKKSYIVGELEVKGIMRDGEYLVCITTAEKEFFYDPVEVRQIVSKLNKLIHSVNKTESCKVHRYEMSLEEYEASRSRNMWGY